MEELLRKTFEEYKDCHDGEVADYIPQLATVDPDLFAMSIVTVDGDVYSSGAADTAFTVQSMSKPFVYALALEHFGDKYLSDAVGVEPTGESFNSLVKLNSAQRPFNPMVNSGAITTTDVVMRKNTSEPIQHVVDFLSKCALSDLRIDQDVFTSEYETGDRNRAIAYLLKNKHCIEGPVEQVLRVYFGHCSINAKVTDVAKMAATFAAGGIQPLNKKRVLSAKYVPLVLSVMMTCGMYNSAGSWMCNVGLPAKSGVSGGIFVVVPGKMGIAVYSPRLDKEGTSVRGRLACEKISRELGLHLFDV